MAPRDSSDTRERRQRNRARMLKTGKILLGKTAVPCTLRNLSDTGACLQVQATYGIPAAFEFKLDDQPPRACKVVWLDGSRIGIQFV